MPTTIPFDPALVLGNIVDPKKITALEAIATAQEPIDSSQQKLNDLILSRRSMDMTLQEMVNLGVDAEHLDKLTEEIKTLTDTMANAAVELGEAVVKAEGDIQKARAEAGQIKINDAIESPIDYNKSALKQLPLSSDTMTLNVQFFRKETEDDRSSAYANSIATYVSAQCSGFLSPSVSPTLAASAKKAVESQSTRHGTQGTLVITANCTHRQAEVWAPFILDAEKGVRAWNATYPSDQINVTDAASVKDAIEGKPGDPMYLLSGATYGSSFIGLVHISLTEDSASSQSSSALSAAMSTTVSEHLCLENFSGKFGLDGSTSDNLKRLLSSSELESHCSLITAGIIPNITSDTVATTVQTLKPDPTEIMGQLAAIQGSSDTDVKSLSASAAKAKAGEQFMELNNAYIANSVSALGKIDTANNKVIDTNSLMIAMEDYVTQARAGTAGVPINFFLKPVTKNQLAEAYLYKFYGNEFEGASSGDDDPTK